MLTYRVIVTEIFLSAGVLQGPAHYAVNAKQIRNIAIYFASGHKPSPGPCYICFVNNDVKTAVYLPYTVILSFIAVDGSITNVLHKNILYRTLCLRDILSLFAVSRSITGVLQKASPYLECYA